MIEGKKNKIEDMKNTGETVPQTWMRADLHVHSVYSDGSMSFRDILSEAKRLRIGCLAFADHDCTARGKEAEALGQEYGIRVIPAVELSACDPSTGRKVHILGYGFKKTEPIEDVCGPVLKRRHENCLRQIEILRKMGYEIEPERVMKYAVGGTIYKQHILKYLFDSGQSRALFGEVYRTVFKNGGPCDFDIEYAEAIEAVRAVREAGGLPVLAHPGQQQNFDLVAELAAEGLAGIERNHPANTRRHRELISELAQSYGLFCTGGSDFHGEYEARPSGLGCCTAPEDCPLIV